MTQLNPVPTKDLSIACDEQWEIEIEIDPESAEKIITIWIVNPENDRRHFLTFCSGFLSRLAHALNTAEANLKETE